MDKLKTYSLKKCLIEWSIDIISLDEESANEQQNWDKTFNNKTLHHLVKISVFFRFLFDEKTIINICSF